MFPQKSSSINTDQQIPIETTGIVFILSEKSFFIDVDSGNG